jgi:ABC-type nitrate/sulfonate/bicarbonate transport system substrate-binding protein
MEEGMIRHWQAAGSIPLGSLISLAAAILFAGPASAADPMTLRINAFPNAKALPLHAGIANGIFERHGFKIDLELTEGSRPQREGLASGKTHVAHSAVDNALAMIEVAKEDVIIVSGGDSGMNEFFVQGTIDGFADLRGRTLVVDAPDTAYALQLKKILARHGLKDGDYKINPVGAGPFRFKALMEDKSNAGGILNLPFTVQAEQAGMKSLGRTIDMLGAYQGAGAFTMRAWAEKNKDTLERYLAAYIESVRWVRAPANKAANIAILVDKLKLSAREAERTYELLLDPAFGFTPDAAFDREGFKNVLALRAELERKAGTDVPPPERYVDLAYYERAMKVVGR